ncbi:MAG: hypothetical protein WBJ55_11585 [Limnochordia bacterium]
MRKISLVLLTTLLVLALSVSAFAAKKVKYPSAEWEFGDDKDQWGLVYELFYDSEGEFPEEGYLKPFYKINGKKGPWNITVKGAYIKDGQKVDTVFGARLPVNYSPYIAKFDSKSRIVGLSVGTFNYEFGPVVLALQGGWMFSHVTLADNQDDVEGSPNSFFGPRRNDILLDVDSTIADVLDLDIALNRYSVPVAGDPDKLYDYYYNVAVEAQLTDVVPGLTLTGLYAFYSQDKDWLYEVTADYEVIPETLWLRAGHRNSMFWEDHENEVEGTWNKPSVLGGPDASDGKTRYIADTKPIENLYKRGNSINVGATYKFTYDVLEAELKADYDTTNPKARGDLDDLVSLSLNTTALGFELNQKFDVLLLDEDTTARDSAPVLDGAKNRLDYALDFYTPQYSLPVDFADVFVQGIVNFDWDKNYVADSRYHAIAAVEVGATADVWRLPNLYLGGIFAYDMPSDKDLIKNPFKFALISKYDAPNGIKFRLEYLSSVDYATKTKFVHNDDLNARYDDIRYYGNSKFHGIRLSVGFPL